MNDRQSIFNYVVAKVRSGDYRVRKDDIEIDCPSCGGHKKFAVNVQKGMYGCFICPTKGSVGFLIRENPREWRGVRDTLSDFRGSRSVGPDLKPGDVTLPLYPIGGYSSSTPAPRPLGGIFPSTVERAVKYCLGRGMTMDQIIRYKVGILPLVNRVYFPYWEPDGKMTYWMGRSTNPVEEPKTLEPGNQELKPLFGQHVGSWDKSGPLLLVEGVFDHFATPNSYALMGSFLSEANVRKIAKANPTWVAVLLDPDAVWKAQSLCKTLWKAGVKCSYVRWTDTSKDPGDLGWDRMSGVETALSRMSVPIRPGEIRVRVGGLEGDDDQPDDE